MTLLAHCMFTLRKIPQTSVSRVFTEGSLPRYDWLNHWPCVWTQFLAPLSLPRDGEARLIAHGSKAQPSDYMVGLWGITCPHSESPLWDKYQKTHQETPHSINCQSPWIMKPLLSLRKGQGFEVLPQEPQAKTRQIIYYNMLTLGVWKPDKTASLQSQLQCQHIYPSCVIEIWGL